METRATQRRCGLGSSPAPLCSEECWVDARSPKGTEQCRDRGAAGRPEGARAAGSFVSLHVVDDARIDHSTLRCLLAQNLAAQKEEEEKEKMEQ